MSVSLSPWAPAIAGSLRRGKKRFFYSKASQNRNNPPEPSLVKPKRRSIASLPGKRERHLSLSGLFVLGRKEFDP